MGTRQVDGLAPEPVTRHSSLTTLSTCFLWVFSFFFEIGRFPLHFPEIGQQCSDNYVPSHKIERETSDLKKDGGNRK